MYVFTWLLPSNHRPSLLWKVIDILEYIGTYWEVSCNWFLIRIPSEKMLTVLLRLLSFTWFHPSFIQATGEGLKILNSVWCFPHICVPSRLPHLPSLSYTQTDAQVPEVGMPRKYQREATDAISCALGFSDLQLPCPVTIYQDRKDKDCLLLSPGNSDTSSFLHPSFLPFISLQVEHNTPAKLTPFIAYDKLRLFSLVPKSLLFQF